MKGDERVVKKLDELLSDELTAIMPVHGPFGDVRQLGLRAAASSRGEARPARDASRREVDRPDHLPGRNADGQPIEPGPYRRGRAEATSCRIMEAELHTIGLYNEAIHLSDEANDAATRTCLNRSVKEEDAHVDWLEEQLDQVAQLGCAAVSFHANPRLAPPRGSPSQGPEDASTK